MLGIFSKVTGKIWRCTGYMLQRNPKFFPHIQMLRFLERENGTGSLPETTAESAAWTWWAEIYISEIANSLDKMTHPRYLLKNQMSGTL